MMKIIRASKFFSTHSKVCIIGGGTGGLGVSAQLLRKNIHASDIRIIEPSENHYYQPGWTMVGAKLCQPSLAVRKMQQILPSQIPLTQQRVVKIDPQSRTVFTKNGQEFTYDQLVLATGLKLDWEKIKGAKELLDNPNTNVCSIYGHNYAQKTAKLGSDFKGGHALFMEPPLPIKCAGAPQKILYLWTDAWQKKRIAFDVQFVKSAQVLFAQPKYCQALNKVAKDYGIKVTLAHTLLQVSENTATFKNNLTQQEITKKFDFLHLVPPMSAHTYITESGLGNQQGFVDLNQNNLRHSKYVNIWGVGDCTSLPTSKTAAGAIQQTQVVVRNMVAAMRNPDIIQLPEAYQGYTSCPLLVGKGKLMLAEFKYEHVADQTFFEHQEVPNRVFYYMKRYLFPNAYWHLMPRGIWRGRKGIRFD